MNSHARFCSTCGAALTDGVECVTCGVGRDGLYRRAGAVGFGEAISTCMSKYATFKGRASRSEFWYFVLFFVIVASASLVLDLVTGTEIFGKLNRLFGFATTLPWFAVASRRLHDVNRSGWFQLLYLPGLFALAFGVSQAVKAADYSAAIDVIVALIGVGLIVWQIVLFATRGTPGPNRFG